MKHFLLTLVLVMVGDGLFAAPFFDALRSGDLKKIKAQVEVVEVDVNKVGEYGVSPLLFCNLK